MRDGFARRVLKATALAAFYVDVGVSRGLARAAGNRPYRLAGRCRRSGQCCEAPAIAVSRPVWYLPSLRRLFLWWQHRVNGFVLTGQHREQRVLVFHCTHFDWTDRTCDSYASRPGMCRDYPRLLLGQPDPVMLPGCGHRVVLRNARAMLAALARQDLGEEQLERLKRELRLE